MQISKIFSKPIRVTWFRVKQHINLLSFQHLQLWQAKEMKVARLISRNQCYKKSSNITSGSYLSTIKSLGEQSDTIKALDLEVQKIINGEFNILGASTKIPNPLEWNCDWRHKHYWKNKYYKSYFFYETDKPIPYDIKFPWELSRLAFLIPVAQQILITNEIEKLEWIHKILSDWDKSNPLAYSVNWYPMEVSIRAINLIQLREILIIHSNQNQKANDVITLINRILLSHGIFLWRNIEYTDVRGNHYAANLCALLLLGTVYTGFYNEASKWLKYSKNRIENEFKLQFLEDGVNFEKSLPYHRLVVELFLISFICLTRSGSKIKESSRKLLQSSCQFIADYSKPNKSTPIIGDNDSASIFSYDNIGLNNHTNLLQLASLFLNVPFGLHSEKINLSSVLMYGKKAINTGVVTESNFTQPLDVHYNKGGFYIKKQANNFFIEDIGEVGMLGRGGHGHNDLFSFELFLNGEDIIVDPGCSTYTGDLKKKKLMRSTEYHNGLMIDDIEIADLTGHWTIKDEATPSNITTTNNENLSIIKGTHNGYAKLKDAVTHCRTISIQNNFSHIYCEDVIACNKSHTIKRFLHLAEGVEVRSENSKIYLITKSENILALEVDKPSQITTSDYYLSKNYGQDNLSKKITLTTNITESSKLFLKIATTKNGL